MRRSDSPALIADAGRILTADRSDAALDVRGLSVSYGQKPAIFSVDASFPEGSMTAIIGPNGAGKSTFLKGVMELTPRLSGQVSFFGGSLSARRDRVAYVPQRASVDWDFPASALDVVLMGRHRQIGPFRFAGRKDRAAAIEALDRMNMARFGERQIGQLSGGQQQRVFLARALAQRADILLLDEPLAGVDAATEATIIDVLKSLRAEGKTVVAVHHDLSTVARYFDRVLLLDVRRIAEGRVEEAFTAETLRDAYGARLAVETLAEAGLAPLHAS